jgi:hypothetical protein
MGNRGKPPLIPNLTAKLWRVVNFSTHCTGGWLGSKAGVDSYGEGKIPCPIGVQTPDRPGISKSLYGHAVPTPVYTHARTHAHTYI